MSGADHQELETVRTIVLRAGSHLLREDGRFGTIDYKSATELVTDLDRLVERQIVSDLVRDFPADAIVAEEGSGSGEGTSGRTWYIDPLDGTTNYVHGYPFYAVSLGCTQGDSLLLGAVYAPYLDELYLAKQGAGARLERPRAGARHPLPQRVPVCLERALLATGFPYIRDETVLRNTEYVKKFLLSQCHGVRRGGSAAIDLCHVAAGKLDGYWEMNLRPWDVAAGTLVAREAGAVVTDFQGRAGFLSGETIVAAAPELHEKMKAILQQEAAHGNI
jgi:myo-inositol-1(or 4)-monophosphatase